MEVGNHRICLLPNFAQPCPCPISPDVYRTHYVILFEPHNNPDTDTQIIIHILEMRKLEK